MMTAFLVMTALTAANPFAAKARPYDAQHYTLEMRLDNDGTFKNKLTAKLKATKPLKDIEFDAYNLNIEFALVDGVAAVPSPRYDPDTKTGVLVVKLAKPVAAGKELSVELSYSGKASTTQEGFFRVNNAEGQPPSFFTLFEPNFAQRFYPCNDQPNDKATFELQATVDEQYTVLSNGRKTRDEKFAEGGKNLRRVTWVQDKPQSSYLFAVAVGVFEGVEASSDIPATVWVAPGSKDRVFPVTDSLKPMFNSLVGLTGTRYPWAKLDVVAVPRFMTSGMENTSLIFERDYAVALEHKNDQTMRVRMSGLLAHEMAHQWFGNDVTLATWEDMWLNEGFASYLGGEVADEYNDSDLVEVQRTTSMVEDYFRQEQGPRSHALVPTTALAPEQLFDFVSYLKGGYVLRMLDFWVGRPDFKKVLKAYLDKHAYGSATSADFFASVFEITKKEKELKPFKDSWLNKRGYPVVFPEYQVSGNQLTVKIRQQPNRSDEKGPFVFKLPIVVHRTAEPSYTKEQTILVDKPEVSVTFDVPAAPEWVNWNQNGLALVRVNGPSVSEEQWAAAARHDPDPTWRLIATWNLLGELGNPDMKEETKPTTTAMGAILDVLLKDPSPHVRVGVMNRLLHSRFKKLPSEFSGPVYSLAKRPTDLNDDAIGVIMLKRMALELLGRTDSSEGHQYVLDELGKRDIDINYLEGLAAGAARLGTSSALATLRTAVVTQKSRGYAYYRRTISSLTSIPSAEGVELIRSVLAESDDVLAITLADGAEVNEPLRSTPEWARLVRDVVLGDSPLTNDARSSYIVTIEQVKNDAVKEALMAIAEKSPHAPLKQQAKQVLDANFPLAATKKAPSPPKK